jgi:hypothetical protein
VAPHRPTSAAGRIGAVRACADAASPRRQENSTSKKATGRLNRLGSGADLELERHLQTRIEDVMAEPHRRRSMSRWIGTYGGATGAEKNGAGRMLLEQGDAVSNVLIEVCKPPRRLVVTAKDDHGDCHRELLLSSAGDTTTLKFVQDLDDPKLAGDTGPGWEYYLDMPVAV